jgi:hypothetical protein
MSDPTDPPNLSTITAAAFAAYNAGGPPERANLTHDGRPVPPFEALGPSVSHKWRCAAGTSALAGAQYMIELIAVGVHDRRKLEAFAREAFAAPPYEEPPAPPA